MKAKGFVVVLLLAILALAGTGCSTGSGVEFAAFGSSLDSKDLGDGYGGGAKVELNPIDNVSVDARASWIHFDDTDIDMIPLEAAGLLNFPLLFEHVVPYVGAGLGTTCSKAMAPTSMTRWGSSRWRVWRSGFTRSRSWLRHAGCSSRRTSTMPKPNLQTLPTPTSMAWASTLAFSFAFDGHGRTHSSSVSVVRSSVI